MKTEIEILKEQKAALAEALKPFEHEASEEIRALILKTQTAKTEAALNKINKRLGRLYDLRNAARAALAAAKGVQP